jgi:flagellar hook-associated protein 3 FlgL
MYEKDGKDISLTQGTTDALSVLNFDINAGAVKSTSSQDGISKAISDMDTLMNKVLSIRADAGARMNRAELTLNRLDSDELNFTNLMSQNEDVNMAEVIMNLKNEENVYNASLAGGARIIMPTLVDFLT